MGAPIMILDELDSGVGSRLGQPVAAMLRRMAAPASSAAGSPGTATQILCVSHIPQACSPSLNMLLDCEVCLDVQHLYDFTRQWYTADASDALPFGADRAQRSVGHVTQLCNEIARVKAKACLLFHRGR